jgi:saposin
MKLFVFACFFLFAIKAANSQSLCTQCTTIVTTIEGWVENNATEQQIIQYLDQFCALNPQFQLPCDAIVAYGVPTIIAWLQSNASPDQICKALGVCFKKSTMKVPKDTPFCSYCTTIVSSIEDYLAQNATQEEIEKNVDQLCALLPDEFSLYCEAFIASEIPAIIQYLNQNYTPQQVCSQIGLCATPPKVIKSGKIGIK